MKYKVWATTEEGKGYVQDLGTFEDPTNIQIRIGAFSDDIVITIEEDRD